MPADIINLTPRPRVIGVDLAKAGSDFNSIVLLDIDAIHRQRRIKRMWQVPACPSTAPAMTFLNYALAATVGAAAGGMAVGLWFFYAAMQAGCVKP